jgi:pyruvate kinase
MTTVELCAVAGVAANFEEAKELSTQRPEQLLLLSAKKPKTHRQLSLLWGVNQGSAAPEKAKNLAAEALARAKVLKIAKKGEYIMVLKKSAAAGDLSVFDLKKV